MINCDCQPWNLDPIINRDVEICYLCDKNVSKVRNNNSALVKLSFLKTTANFPKNGVCTYFELSFFK